MGLTQHISVIFRFESRREKMKNIRGKSVKKSRDWIQEKKVRLDSIKN